MTDDARPEGEWRPYASTGDTPQDAAAALARLRARGWTLGVAESLTGGLLAAALISVPGASATVRGAIVAYAKRAGAEVVVLSGSAAKKAALIRLIERNRIIKR